MVTKDTFSYLGSIRTPNTGTTLVVPKDTYPPDGKFLDGFNYGGTPFAYDHVRDELVIGTRYSRVIRLKNVPPTPARGRVNDPKMLDWNSVPMAPYVDGVAADLSNNTWQHVNATDDAAGSAFIGLGIIGDKALAMGNIYYDANNGQRESMFVAEWPITTPRAVSRGAWRAIGDVTKQGWAAGPVTLIPDHLRGPLKGDVLVGQSGSLPIISRQSFGPCAMTVKAVDILNQQVAPCTMLIGYPGDVQGLPGVTWGGPAHDLFNEATRIVKAEFIGDYLVFFGWHGYGDGCYGAGTDNPALTGQPVGDGSYYCFDPNFMGGKGTHAFPYRSQIWVYAVQDMIDVANGLKQPWELVPTWSPLTDLLPVFEEEYYKPNPRALPISYITGVGYDSAKNLVYVCAYAQDGNSWEAGPLIHVLQVNGVTARPNPSSLLVGLPIPGQVVPAPVPTPTPTPTPVDPCTELRAEVARLTLALDAEFIRHASTKSRVQTEVTAILKRNSTLRSKLPAWCTDALKRIQAVVQ